MKYVASCSCGKDSTAMVMKLIEYKWPLDYVVFVDLGKEFNAIYRTWDKICKVLAENNILFKRLTLKQSFDYYFAEREIKSRKGEVKHGYSWCGRQCRWGTTQKCYALENFYKETFGYEPICEYVGIAADERERVSIKRNKNIKMYPLILWDMTENDCLSYCYKHGFTYKEDNGVELYSVLDRVSCFCCAGKRIGELKVIHDKLPEYWERLRAMQQKTSIPFRNSMTIDDLGIRFKQEQLINKFSDISLWEHAGK